MATKENKDYVDVMLPEIEGREDEDFVVGLNGKFYQIRRGEKVSVPRDVYEIIQDVMQQKKEAKMRRKMLADMAKHAANDY